MRVLAIAATVVLIVLSVSGIVGGFAVLARRLLGLGFGLVLASLLPMLRRLPRRVERIASAAEHGRLSAGVRLFADERDRRHATRLLHQILLTILATTAGIMAVLLLGTAGGPRVTPTVGLYQLFGYNLLVVCAILALRVVVHLPARPVARRPGPTRVRPRD